MRWRGREESTNVEDRRRSGGKVAAAGGGIGVIIMMLIYAFMGVPPQQALQQAARQQAFDPADGEAELSADEIERGMFAKVIMKDTEDVWNAIFAEHRQQYRPPTLVLFSGSTTSKCGGASAATGPFYCPADEKVYLDTTFFLQLDRQLGAPGDFAQAYVIAHEVGHHIQKLTGMTDEVEKIRLTRSKVEANRASVKLELQADFYAGVVLHHTQKMKGVIEPGDVEEGLRAATAIGDDRLQENSQGYAVPETFTHGTSEQRLRWFMKGLETGDFRQGNTFETAEL